MPFTIHASSPKVLAVKATSITSTQHSPFLKTDSRESMLFLTYTTITTVHPCRNGILRNVKNKIKKTFQGRWTTGGWRLRNSLSSWSRWLKKDKCTIRSGTSQSSPSQLSYPCVWYPLSLNPPPPESASPAPSMLLHSSCRFSFFFSNHNPLSEKENPLQPAKQLSKFGLKGRLPPQSTSMCKSTRKPTNPCQTYQWLSLVIFNYISVYDFTREFQGTNQNTLLCFGFDILLPQSWWVRRPTPWSKSSTDARNNCWCRSPSPVSLHHSLRPLFIFHSSLHHISVFLQLPLPARSLRVLMRVINSWHCLVSNGAVCMDGVSVRLLPDRLQRLGNTRRFTQVKAADSGTTWDTLSSVIFTGPLAFCGPEFLCFSLSSQHFSLQNSFHTQSCSEKISQRLGAVAQHVCPVVNQDPCINIH